MSTVLKLIVLFGALISLWFAIMLLVFFEQLKVFSESLISGPQASGKEPPKKSGTIIDNHIMAWHFGLGLIILLVAGWLFWVFFRYLAL